MKEKNLKTRLRQNSNEDEKFCISCDFYKKICFSNNSNRLNNSTDFPRSFCEMNIPEINTLDEDEYNSNLRIIDVKKKENIDIEEIKKQRLNDWKLKKEELKKFVDLDLKKTKEQIIYDNILPREIYICENTEDELFLKIEPGSISASKTSLSKKNKFETKLKDTKDKFFKYQTKAIDKLKSIFPPKFMKNSDEFFFSSKNNTLKNKSETLKPLNKPIRPALPKFYDLNKELSPLTSKPPIRPARRKSKKSLDRSLPPSTFYKQLREKLNDSNEKNLNSIYSTSTPNIDRKFSNNQSVNSCNFRYRFRADFHSNLMLGSNFEKESIKSEPTYAINDGLPPKAPPRKRLTVSSYLSGSKLSLHRKLDVECFNQKRDKYEQATDPLFWKPFSWKSGRCRSLTELYLRKNKSPYNSKLDNSQKNYDILTKIYCVPKRPPLPIRLKRRNSNKVNNLFDSMNSQQYWSETETVNQHSGQEFYTVRDAIVGPEEVSYQEKEIQTSLEDFKEIDYEDDNFNYSFENSPRYIDSSTNEEDQTIENKVKEIEKKLAEIEENTLCEDSKTLAPYLSAHQNDTITNINKSSYVTLDYDHDPFDADTMAEIDSLAEASLNSYLTPMNSLSVNTSSAKTKKLKHNKYNSATDTDEDEITDELIGIAANLQKEIKQLVDKKISSD